MTIQIKRTIFRAYDIRGNTLSDLSPLLAYKIGFSFTKMITQAHYTPICVGRDGRLSSPALYEALVNGIMDAGGRVISIEVVPSPALYFADKILGPAGSIMITGSHNPKDDNGFKMLVAGMPFYDKQIQDLYDVICSHQWDNVPFHFTATGKLTELEITEQYIQRILQGITINPKLKVAWDPGNGAACNIIKLLKVKLPNKNLIINSEIDGNFPAHHPDPTLLSNLKELIQLVQSENCDVGIAFDGDGDRLGVISKTGRMILAEQILGILAKDLLVQHPNANIIMDIKTSEAIFNQIKAYGGNPIIWKTGHSYIKDKMHETGALLAGETSGHLFFADKYYGYDDGIYAALRLLELLSKSNKSLDELIDELPQIEPPVEMKIPIEDDKKFMVIKQIGQKLIDQNITFNAIDGIRVSSTTGWWLLRASNTEAKIIARYQPNESEGSTALRGELSSVLRSVNIII